MQPPSNRRMQINQFYMLKSISLSCKPDDRDGVFSPNSVLSFGGMKNRLCHSNEAQEKGACYKLITV